MPRQTSIQLTPQMERQLDDLKSAGFGTNTDVFRIALDRMYQQEKWQMIYAISTINDSPTDRTGWRIYGTGSTEVEAEEVAIDNIGGRNQAKTMREATLYRNLQFVTADQLKDYGLSK